MASIDVETVTIDYTIYGARTTTLQRALVRQMTGGRVFSEAGSTTRIRALDNVSLSLREGDRLGLIGPNGAGKSTLIRALAGCLEPSCGRIAVKGRVTALLSIGAGMDPERTGLENIYHMGLYHLMLPKQMAAHVDEIAEFAELGEFLNLPVRTYSDGMRVRLAFAIATCLQPEILLLDVAIGAGDAHFAAKARKRALNLYSSARLLVMASHADALLRQLCNLGLYIAQGRIVAFGPIDEVLDAYKHAGGPVAA